MQEEAKKIKEIKEFEGLCLEALPVLEQLKEVVKKHGIKELASVTLDAGGYLSFSTHGTSCEMHRLSDGDPVRLRHEWKFEKWLSGEEEK